MNRIFAGAALALFLSGAQSAELDYDSIDFVYATGTQEIEAIGDFDTDGYALNLSIDVANPVGLYAGFASEELSGDYEYLGTRYDVEYEVSGTELGLFFHAPIAASTDIVLQAGMLDLEMEAILEGTKIAEEDADGHALSIGLRSMVSRDTELFARIRQTDIEDETSESFRVGARFYASSRFAFGIAYNQDMDGDWRNAAFSGSVYF